MESVVNRLREFEACRLYEVLTDAEAMKASSAEVRNCLIRDLTLSECEEIGDALSTMQLDVFLDYDPRSMRGFDRPARVVQELISRARVYLKSKGGCHD